MFWLVFSIQLQTDGGCLMLYKQQLSGASLKKKTWHWAASSYCLFLVTNFCKKVAFDWQVSAGQIGKQTNVVHIHDGLEGGGGIRPRVKGTPHPLIHPLWCEPHPSLHGWACSAKGQASDSLSDVLGPSSNQDLGKAVPPSSVSLPLLHLGCWSLFHAWTFNWGRGRDRAWRDNSVPRIKYDISLLRSFWFPPLPSTPDNITSSNKTTTLSGTWSSYLCQHIFP